MKDTNINNKLYPSGRYTLTRHCGRYILILSPNIPNLSGELLHLFPVVSSVNQ